MPLPSTAAVSEKVDADFLRMIEGYSLTTAEILYRMPDHPLFLQTYLWQNYDQAPYFPILTRFLAFWEKNLDGRLHSVTVASSQLLKPCELQVARSLTYLN